MNLFDIKTQPIPKSLREQYIVAPFSILDTRQGYWQKEKYIIISYLV